MFVIWYSVNSIGIPRSELIWNFHKSQNFRMFSLWEVLVGCTGVPHICICLRFMSQWFLQIILLSICDPRNFTFSFANWLLVQFHHWVCTVYACLVWMLYAQVYFHEFLSGIFQPADNSEYMILKISWCSFWVCIFYHDSSIVSEGLYILHKMQWASLKLK